MSDRHFWNHNTADWSFQNKFKLRNSPTTKLTD